jgi:hypothetical protein
MIRRLALACILAGALSSQALAFHCHADMAAIDAAIPTAQLTEKEMARVKELRAQGEELHNAGKHQEAVDTLAEAKQILGIE